MATTARYTFTSKRSGAINLYIHHDGYPQGAADYFKECIEQHGTVTVESMLRTHVRAEVIAGPDTHSTEWVYNIENREDGAVMVEAYRHASRDLIPATSVQEFIQQLLGVEIKRVPGQSVLMTKAMAIKSAAEALQAARDYKSKFPDLTGNVHSSFSRAWNARKFARSFA